MADRRPSGPPSTSRPTSTIPAGALPDLRRPSEPGLRQDPARVFFPEESRSSSGVSYLDSEYSFTSVDLAVGWNRQPWSRFSLGLEGKIGSVEIQNLTNADADASAWGPYIRFEHDTPRQPLLPYQGVYWTSGGLLLRRSRPLGRPPGSLAEGWDYRLLVMIKPLVLGQAQPQPDAGRGGSSSQETGTAVRAGIWGAVPHVRLPSITS